MSKSVDSPLGIINVFDDPAEIERKVKRAVTDTDGEVRFDPEEKPGVANLLALLAAATDRLPADVAKGYERYGDLKDDVAAALVELLAPLRARRLELLAEPSVVEAALRDGAARATRWQAPPTPGRRGRSGCSPDSRAEAHTPPPLEHVVREVVEHAGVGDRVEQEEPDDDEHRVRAHPEVGGPPPGREHALDQHRAVERRERQQVEDAEPDVGQAEVEEDLGQMGTE